MAFDFGIFCSKTDRDLWRPELIAYYDQKLTEQLKKHGVDRPFSLADLKAAFDLAQPFAVNGQLLAVPFICEWNAKNMDEADREVLFRSCDDLLDEFIANIDKGTHEWVRE